MPQLDPRQVRDLLKDQPALGQALSNPETQKLLARLRTKDPDRLKAAAQAAMAGDPSGLSALFRELSRDPDSLQAMEKLQQTLTK